MCSSSDIFYFISHKLSVCAIKSTGQPTKGPSIELILINAGVDPGIYFGGPNQVFQSKVEGEARIEGEGDRGFSVSPSPENV